MNIIISGGGTGGHIYPAIAIAQTLRKQFPSCNILFVGAEGKMEMEKVPKAGFEIKGLPIRGLQRSLSIENLKFPFRLLSSLWQARQIIQQFQPHVCIGVGGYASGAVLQMAALANIPIIIQEQNSYAGMTNKLLSRYAKKICVAYPNMEKFFPKEKIVFTGNPVRNDLINLDSLKEKSYTYFNLNTNQKTILVVGGSLGAKSINQAILQQVDKIIENYQLVWQTGNTDFQRITQKLGEKNLLAHKNLVVKDFIYEMQFAYSIADIVISRAGALAISELSLAGKPCIFVPFPFAAEDHQTKNALSLVEAHAALLVKDSVANNKLVDLAHELLQDTAQQESLQKNIKTFAKPKAAEEIVAEIVKLITL
jgi:UDP-N-acetylglucosamine--N-acetylmuramyl-(pentapeptide) pyrophosphoryl-undecaprenol N-acetylglucosamine transferase